MRTILFIVAILFIMGWLLGFFIYSVGYLIHFLLVLAIVAILITLIRKR